MGAECTQEGWRRERSEVILMFIDQATGFMGQSHGEGLAERGGDDAWARFGVYVGVMLICPGAGESPVSRCRVERVQCSEWTADGMAVALGQLGWHQGQLSIVLFSLGPGLGNWWWFPETRERALAHQHNQRRL